MLYHDGFVECITDVRTEVQKLNVLTSQFRNKV